MDLPRPATGTLSYHPEIAASLEPILSLMRPQQSSADMERKLTRAANTKTPHKPLLRSTGVTMVQDFTSKIS